MLLSSPYLPPPAPVCREAGELVRRSQEVRGGIEGLIVSIETQKTQAHNNITSSVAHSVQEANSRKVIETFSST